MTVGAKIRSDVPPAPAAKPCTRNEQKRRHNEDENRAKAALTRAWPQVCLGGYEEQFPRC